MSEPVSQIRRGWIYKLTSPSGSAYIGQTVQRVSARWSKHKTQAESGEDEECCRALANAIRKYGWDSFKKEILLECNESELDAKETELIKSHGTFWRDGGYNLTTGGQAPRMSEETKARMRKSALKSARVYKKNDPTLPRGVQWVKRNNTYRIELIGNGDEYIYETFAVKSYPSQDAAKEAAITRCAELRAKLE